MGRVVQASCDHKREAGVAQAQMVPSTWQDNGHDGVAGGGEGGGSNEGTDGRQGDGDHEQVRNPHALVMACAHAENAEKAQARLIGATVERTF